MDTDRIKGKVKDISGRLERQVGEWTGDKDAQLEGAGKQAEGKIQKATDKLKDKARVVARGIKTKSEEQRRQIERAREVNRKKTA